MAVKNLFNAGSKVESEKVRVDDKYTKKVQIPQYLPSKVKPNIWELCDKTKYYELTRNIALSDLPEDVKEFLMFAATRHIVFNYDKIADYYAHADCKLQSLMEESALVIIDIDDAIANGYVRLSETLQNIMDTSGELTK